MRAFSIDYCSLRALLIFSSGKADFLVNYVRVYTSTGTFFMRRPLLILASFGPYCTENRNTKLCNKVFILRTYLLISCSSFISEHIIPTAAALPDKAYLMCQQ